MAWKQYRIKDFRRYVDRMFCILPFEVEFFRNLDYPVDYVGNPSVDSVPAIGRNRRPDLIHSVRTNSWTKRPVLALLAGSRRQEIKDNLPTMLKVAAAIRPPSCDCRCSRLGTGILQAIYRRRGCEDRVRQNLSSPQS